MILTDYKKHKDAKLKMRLFWDVDTKTWDVKRNKNLVVHRVVEFGDIEDWWAMLNLFGVDVVREEIKHINLLTNKDIKFVSGTFGIALEDMNSYRNKIIGKKHWREDE